MSIHGIGCDLIEIDRVARVYARFGDKLMQRVLTPKEILQAREQRSVVPRLAKYIAAKEAGYKALGVPRGSGIGWQHFEVSYNSNGAPKLGISAQARACLPKIAPIHLSLSDTDQHAMAYVVIEV